MMALTQEQQAGWDDDGFFIIPGFATVPTVEAMQRRIVELARDIDAGADRPDLHVLNEGRLADAPTADARLSKIFRVMRTEPVFRDFATDARLLDIVAALLGGDVDCFLSQFIFKHPGALGQPWHQDNFYFRMTPTPQVGIWLACTAATLENGPLWVVPGSHRETIHEVEPDTRPGASIGYVEITTADTTAEEVVLMEPGDLLVFHSHLRHRSTDNLSDDMRAAMVYHYAVEATEGFRAFNQDWVEVLRGGEPVVAATAPVPISE